MHACMHACLHESLIIITCLLIISTDTYRYGHACMPLLCTQVQAAHNKITTGYNLRMNASAFRSGATTDTDPECSPTYFPYLCMTLFQILLLVSAFAAASRHLTLLSSLSVDVAHSGESNFGGSGIPFITPVNFGYQRDFRHIDVDASL
jgi:hypothetical protein